MATVQWQEPHVTLPGHYTVTRSFTYIFSTNLQPSGDQFPYNMAGHTGGTGHDTLPRTQLQAH